jgi:hypothetical protein
MFTPAVVRIFATWILEAFLDDKIFADTMRATKAKNVSDYWKLISEKDQYIRRFYETVGPT